MRTLVTTAWANGRRVGFREGCFIGFIAGGAIVGAICWIIR